MTKKHVFWVVSAFMAVNAAYWMLAFYLCLRDGDTQSASVAFWMGIVPITGTVGYAYLARRQP